jgi:hypothetical protein
MKHYSLVVLTTLVAINLGLYAQDKDTTQLEPKIKLELVYNKQLDEMMVGSEGFPPSEIKQIFKDKEIPQEDKNWLLNSLRIEIARNEKILYTNDGKTIKLPNDFHFILTSKNNQYIIVYSYNENKEAITLRDVQNNALKKSVQLRKEWEKALDKDKQVLWDSVCYWVQLHDSLSILIKKVTNWYTTKYIFIRVQDGAILWEKENMPLPSHIHISNDGKTVIVVPSGSSFLTKAIFYDETGNEKKTVDGLFGPGGCHDMSADGEMFSVISRKSPEDTLSIAVISYNNRGAQLWIKEVPGIWPFTNPSIAVSPNHKYIAVSLMGNHWWREAFTTLLDLKGNIITTINCSIYNPVFSSDDKYLVLASDRDTLYFLRTDDGTILWQKWMADLSENCNISNEAEYLYINSKQKPFVSSLLDKNGNLLTAIPADGQISPCGKILLTSAGIYVTRGVK